MSCRCARARWLAHLRSLARVCVCTYEIIQIANIKWWSWIGESIMRQRDVLCASAELKYKHIIQYNGTSYMSTIFQLNLNREQVQSLFCCCCCLAVLLLAINLPCVRYGLVPPMTSTLALNNLPIKKSTPLLLLMVFFVSFFFFLLNFGISYYGIWLIVGV